MPLINEQARVLDYEQVYYTYAYEEDAQELIHELNVEFVPLFIYVEEGIITRSSASYLADDIEDLIVQFFE